MVEMMKEDRWGKAEDMVEGELTVRGPFDVQEWQGVSHTCQLQWQVNLRDRNYDRVLWPAIER